MNKDQDSLSLKERFELIISDKAVQRELKKVQADYVVADQVNCADCHRRDHHEEEGSQRNESSPILSKRKRKQARKDGIFLEDEEDHLEKESSSSDTQCMNQSIYDIVQCMVCYSTPVKPFECKRCQKLICHLCLAKLKPYEDEDSDQIHHDPNMQMCPHCQHRDLKVFTTIKNRILSDIIDQIKVSHQCKPTSKRRTFRIVKLREHLNDCQGNKVKCVCDPEGKNKMTMRELLVHLKTTCGMVRIQCEYCHADQSNDFIEQASFTRDQFKKHRCYIQMQNLIKENDKEVFLYQKYKEEFEAHNNFKLEIKCFNKCGNIYQQRVMYSTMEEFCSACKAKSKRGVISECQVCDKKFCEKCFMHQIQCKLFMDQI